MSPKLRKLIGAGLLLPGLCAYLLGAALLGALLPSNVLIQTPFYALAGVAWAFPTYFLIRWMERPSRNRTEGAGDGQTRR